MLSGTTEMQYKGDSNFVLNILFILLESFLWNIFHFPFSIFNHLFLFILFCYFLNFCNYLVCLTISRRLIWCCSISPWLFSHAISSSLHIPLLGGSSLLWAFCQGCLSCSSKLTRTWTAASLGPQSLVFCQLQAVLEKVLAYFSAVALT